MSCTAREVNDETLLALGAQLCARGTTPGGAVSARVLLDVMLRLIGDDETGDVTHEVIIVDRLHNVGGDIVGELVTSDNEHAMGFARGAIDAFLSGASPGHG